MRLRQIALASLACGLLLAVMPAASLAARKHGPQHNRGLTIAATPQTIISGEGVMIYGQLDGTDVSGQTIRLYHKVAGHPDFTLIGKTTTDADGYYEFTREEGVVTTNRSWYVTAPGVTPPAGTKLVHSKTVHEHVAALVSLTSPVSSATSNHKFVLAGTVSPNQPGQKVILQEQTSSTGSHWTKLTSAPIKAGTFTASYRFKTPGDYTVRAYFRGDAKNTAAASTPITVDVTQAQVADFTIGTSSSDITVGQGATISGVLFEAGSTTPDPGVSVSLWAKTAGHKFATVGTPVETGDDGSYSFSVTPQHNTVYQVRTTDTPIRHSALLFEGVSDLLSPNSSPTSAVVGQKIKFTGAVSPDKAGHAIYLERLGADGFWHVVEDRKVGHDSTYSFGWTFGHAGTAEFRVAIPGGPDNIGAVSSADTVTVTLPPVSTLPPATS